MKHNSLSKTMSSVTFGTGDSQLHPHYHEICQCWPKDSSSNPSVRDPRLRPGIQAAFSISRIIRRLKLSVSKCLDGDKLDLVNKTLDPSSGRASLEGRSRLPLAPGEQSLGEPA